MSYLGRHNSGRPQPRARPPVFACSLMHHNLCIIISEI